MTSGKIRVLVIDDSAVVRQFLQTNLNAVNDIEVVATAPNAEIGLSKIGRFKPDILTLDVEMPGMDGLTFLKKVMGEYPVPVIMCSALTSRGTKTSMDALASGAVDVVAKPKGGFGAGMVEFVSELVNKIRIGSKAKIRPAAPRPIPMQKPPAGFMEKPAGMARSVIAIGASTGGPDALTQVLSALPNTLPGILIVQHMPAGFTKAFATRLNGLCQMEVREALDHDELKPGLALIAPGDRHMEIQAGSPFFKVRCFKTKPVCGHMPSVEVLMRSVARTAKGKAVGVMMTGMGADGADGMVALRASGAVTFAQDEESSVVFGMPKEAYTRGGAERLVPLRQLPGYILNGVARVTKS